MSLTNYTEQPISNLLAETGSFFAFSNQQLAEKKKEGINYCNMGAGLICPKENAEKFRTGYAEIIKNAIAQDLAENGKEKIILRELINYECFYLGDPTEATDNLSDYGITAEEVQEVFNKNYDKYSDF